MGPYISIHDGFSPRAQWYNFIPNGDRLAIDSHPYVCFGAQSAGPIEIFEPMPCQLWAKQVNQSMAGFGLTTAGEFSNAVNDCGLYVNGVNLGSRFEGTYPGFPDQVGDCTPWLNWENWDQDLKTGLMKFALTSMDALQVISFNSFTVPLSQRSLRTTFSGRGRSATPLQRAQCHCNLGKPEALAPATYLLEH